MIKKIKTFTQQYIEFTEEECDQLDIKSGDRFFVDFNKNAEQIIFTKKPKFSLDLNSLTKEELVKLVKMSMEEDCAINDLNLWTQN